MALFLNINTDEVVSFTNKLEKLHKSALPVAIRSSLNAVALDVKKRTLLMVTDQTFTIRKKNFFRVFSKVDFAKGFNVNSMQSAIGIFPKGNDAAEDLEAQERGGRIGGRSYIPTDLTRTGMNEGKGLSKKKTLSNFKKFKKVAWGDKKGFFKTARKVGKEGAFVYGSMVLQVKSLKRKKGKTFIKADKIYSYKKGRSVSISGTGFMRKSALISRKKMPDLYIKEAEKQINRLR